MSQPTAPTGPNTPAPLRDAASLILIRGALGPAPSVLMGQRGAKAAFMPSKYVFPGGAVDAADASVPLDALPAPQCMARLAQRPITENPPSAHSLLVSAIRELWEETGLRLARPAVAEQQRPDIPDAWQPFFAEGLRADASAMRFVFRAVTPPGRPRRFDARFLLAPAEAVVDDLDDFSRAQDELSHLHWVPLSEARALDLPFITEVVLAEVEAMLPDLPSPPVVPFVLNDDTNRIEMLD